MATLIDGRTPDSLRADVVQLTNMRDEARARHAAVGQARAQEMLDATHATLLRHNLSLSGAGRAILAEEDAGKAQPARSLKPGVRRALASSRLGREILRDDYGQTV